MCKALKHYLPGVHLHIDAPKDLTTIDPEIIDRMKGLRLLLVDALEEYVEQEGFPEAGFEAVSTLVALGQQFLREMPSPVMMRVSILSRTLNKQLMEKTDVEEGSKPEKRHTNPGRGGKRSRYLKRSISWQNCGNGSRDAYRDK